MARRMVVVAVLALAAGPFVGMAPAIAQPAVLVPPPEEKEKEKPNITWLFIDAHLRLSTFALPNRNKGPLVGVMVGTRVDVMFAQGLQNGRSRATFGIGGGGGGLEGIAAAAVAYGARLPFGKNHGPIIRGGLAFRYEGSDSFLSSYLQLPQAQVGYQWLGEKASFEIAGTGALVLAGRFNTEDDGVRKLDLSLGWGGVATFMLRGLDLGSDKTFAEFSGFRFDAELLRVQAKSAPKTPVDQLRAHACVADFFAACLDASWSHGDEEISPGAGATTPTPTPTPTFRDASVFYGGLSIGIGAVFADSWQ